METPSRFWLWFALLLAFPAAVHLAAALYEHALDAGSFIWNYGWMALPQGIVGLAALNHQARRLGLLLTLLCLGLGTAGFQFWLLAAYNDDASLMWVLLYPITSFAILLACLSVWGAVTFIRRRLKHSGAAPNNSSKPTPLRGAA